MLGTGSADPISKRRIRVARIITRLNVGGPAIQAILLTEGLDPERYETFLVCGHPGPREGDIRDLRGRLARPALEVPQLGREIEPFADLRAFVRLVRALRAFHPDVVHTHLAKAGLLGRIAARFAGAQIVIHTFHGNVLHGYFGPVRTAIFIGIERMLAHLSTRIIAISPQQVAELRRLGIGRSDQIVHIPLGLDLQPFLDPPRGLLRRELGLADGERLVGIIGRLVPIKAVDLFLDAAAILHDRYPDVHFLIVGDGDERDRLCERADELGLGSTVRFLGWRADVTAVYADCDVVVLTSRNEGTPVSLIEALACARPVVATRVGGVADLLGDCGLLVETGDATAVAAAVERLLGDPLLSMQLGAAGRQRVYPRYDQSELVARIDELYAGLLHRQAAIGPETASLL